MIVWKRARRSATLATWPSHRLRCISTSTLDRLAEPVQSYISTSRDPYINLSIEHFLLQKTAPNSAVLLLYVNRPSLIIGRNQNPWLEVNLALLDSSDVSQQEPEPPGLGSRVDLVRRRSGGGTVFHDEGNVNWTVISPSAHFTRDKHAEMVVGALRSCGVGRARVNERHDIVLDQGERGATPDVSDTHATPYHSSDIRPLKVSGSAYKLTRNRALHHGTCLLSSPNLNIIPHYLHSPAKPYMSARGVESVSSPVGNILLDNEDFITAVQAQFAKLYNRGQPTEAAAVGEEWLDHEPIQRGYEELRSLEWTYLQTPQFTINTEQEPSIDVGIDMTVRNGALTSGLLGGQGGTSVPQDLIGTRLHEIESWDRFLDAWIKGSNFRPLVQHRRELATWLGRMLPTTLVGRRQG